MKTLNLRLLAAILAMIAGGCSEDTRNTREAATEDRAPRNHSDKSSLAQLLPSKIYVGHLTSKILPGNPPVFADVSLHENVITVRIVFMAGNIVVPIRFSQAVTDDSPEIPFAAKISDPRGFDIDIHGKYTPELITGTYSQPFDSGEFSLVNVEFR